jgi:hypothetical protein
MPSPSRRELILRNLKEVLEATGGGGGGPGPGPGPGGSIGATVYRGRAVPIARAEFPAIIIEPVEDQPEVSVHTKTDWTLTVRIGVLVRSETPDAAADPYLVDIHDRVMADPSRGLVATDTLPGPNTWELVEADGTVGIVSDTFIVQYRTERDDLTSA